jgi:hypothetical protein
MNAYHLCIIMIFQSGKIMGSLPIVGVSIVSRCRVVRLHSIYMWVLVRSSVRHRICQAGSKWSKGLHLEPLACLPSKTSHISYEVSLSEPTLFSACYHNHSSHSQQRLFHQQIFPRNLARNSRSKSELLSAKATYYSNDLLQGESEMQSLSPTAPDDRRAFQKLMDGRGSVSSFNQI